MDDIDRMWNESLTRKLDGGVRLDVFVSQEIWLGGMHESRSHQPFVAVGPSGWDGEEELTFFKNLSEVDSFIERLRDASRKAFGDSEA